MKKYDSKMIAEYPTSQSNILAVWLHKYTIKLCKLGEYANINKLKCIECRRKIQNMQRFSGLFISGPSHIS